MYHKIDEFLTDWAYESGKTHEMFAALTDESLSQSVTDGHRTIGRIAWHITQTIPEMMGRTGLKAKGPKEDAPVPSDATAIAEAYKEAADSLTDQINSNWDDSTLAVTDDMYGETWARGMTLGALIKHEVHHRGQLTVLMRQAGLVVAGPYGPAKEQWSGFGAPEPAI